jgi:ribosomal protein S18 acetylase RimI-like enzyme
VWLSVRPGNARAQHVYERLGFGDFVAPEPEMLRHRAAIGRSGPPRSRLMILHRP